MPRGSVYMRKSAVDAAASPAPSLRPKRIDCRPPHRPSLPTFRQYLTKPRISTPPVEHSRRHCGAKPHCIAIHEPQPARGIFPSDVSGPLFTFQLFQMSGQVVAGRRRTDIAVSYCHAKKQAYVRFNNENLPITLASPALGKSPLCSRPAGLVFQARARSGSRSNKRNCANGIADAISRFPRLAA